MKNSVYLSKISIFSFLGYIGTQWHLCKTNWLGEVTVALDDLSSTLDACSLKDGDCLIVQYGSLVRISCLSIKLKILYFG